MECCVPNFRVRVLKVLDDNWNHFRNVVDIVDVFADLRESHQTGVFETPVLIVGNRILDDRAHEWQANGVADG